MCVFGHQRGEGKKTYQPHENRENRKPGRTTSKIEEERYIGRGKNDDLD